MNKPLRKTLRWAAIVAVVGVLLVSIVRRQRTGTTAQGNPGHEAQISAAAPAPGAGSSGRKPARDWGRGADGLASFTGAEFQALVEEALTIENPETRATILGDILAAWLKADGRSFHKYFMALEVAADSDKLAAIIAALKTALPQVADQIASSQTLQEIVRRFMAHFARSDPAGALEWATTWLRGDSHDSALVQILGPLAARDAALARSEIEKVRSPLRRLQALAAVGGSWARTEATAAATWAAQIAAPTERAMTLNSVLLTLARNDPTAAAGHLGNTSRAMVGEYAVKYRNDLAAMNLTELDVVNNTEAYRELLNDGAVPPPNSPDVELLAEAARVIGARLAESDPGSASTWAASLGNEYLRLNAMQGALTTWILRDPQSALNHYQTNFGQYRDMLASAYGAWAAARPAEAAAGVALLQDSIHRGIATQTVARDWAASDPATAASWLDQLPAGERNDEARLAIATALAPTHPVEAWNRAFEITNPSLQYRALKSAFAVMVSTDPARARATLQAARLSPTNSERLGEMLRAVE